jgi:hypothetical protein
MATEETETNPPRASRASRRALAVETPETVAAPPRRNSISAGVEPAENAGTGRSRGAADADRSDREGARSGTGGGAASGSAENRPQQSNAWDRFKRVFQRDGSTRQASEDRSAGDPAPARATSTSQERGAPGGDAAVSEDESRRARLRQALADRYVVSGNEYRFRGEPSRVAFVVEQKRVSTEHESSVVIQGMIDAAQGVKGWRSLNAVGTEQFRRQVWVEGSLRGVDVQGFSPKEADRTMLEEARQKRMEERNRIEQGAPPRDRSDTQSGRGPDSPQRAAGETAPSRSRRDVVMTALDEVMKELRVPPEKREAVLEAAGSQYAQRAAAGREPVVKVYDPSAPSEVTRAPRTVEPARQRERSR